MQPPPPPTSVPADIPAHAESGGLVVLGRYRLLRPLGAGAFGTVWLAEDERLERAVAVKLLPRARVIDGRFEREARAAARLSHPAIVTLYEAAVEEETAYLVSELVRGFTLGRLLDQGRLSDRDIVTIGATLCDALEHAHGQGVIHRDVKPSNILVPDDPASPGEVAKLTDFGVARLIGGDALTHTGDVVGTAAYMSPEQAEGQTVDSSADLYSLAVVLYEALTGVNRSMNLAGSGRLQRTAARLPPVSRYRRDLPRDLAQAIDWALRRGPAERGTIGELRAALAEALEKVNDRPGVVEPAWPTRVLRQTVANAGPWPARARPARAPWPARARWEARVPWPARVPWAARVLAALAAGATAAWLSTHAFVSPPLPAVHAGAIAGLAVALLPGLGWLALTATAAIGLSVDARPGAAIVVLVAAAIPIALLPRRATRWPLAAVAPAFGVILLAGAWPAVAAFDTTPWRRASLGAAGWVWLAAAGLIAGHGVYTSLPRGIPQRSVWMGSIDQTMGHPLLAILRSGLLAPALIWAAAAALLPWLMRGSPALRAVLVIGWAGALASATVAVLDATHASIGPRPAMLVVGAVAAGVVALISAALRRRPGVFPSPDTPAGLA